MARELVNVYAGLGANLGHARQSIDSAILALGKLPETLLVGRSSFYQSAPFQADGPDYTNAVVHLRTRLNAIDLLRAFQSVEDLAGRERPYRNAPRTLDIDLLLYGNGNIQSPELQVPHPRMHERAFVLLPLSELAPGLVTKDELRNVQAQVVTRL
ncbi:MAG: 2-amino-4-hydroxy-6-hydroxymethyldihydropteridine pyrophosphokinae [Pseudomonadota bacterium]|jgi:2-amino-4-hydroxy-6-hydroxymethyldihydropteridine diphosphokinase